MTHTIREGKKEGRKEGFFFSFRLVGRLTFWLRAVDLTVGLVVWVTDWMIIDGALIDCIYIPIRRDRVRARARARGRTGKGTVKGTVKEKKREKKEERGEKERERGEGVWACM